MFTDPEPTVAKLRSGTERTAVQVARLQSTVDCLLADARDRVGRTSQVDNDLVQIISRVVDQQRAANPEVAIDVEGPPTCRLGIDGPAVERALVALLDNAARHAPAGSAVRVALVTDDQEARVSVTDAGEGIDASDTDRIFDRYYGDSGQRSGIGLAIVRQVAASYGGVEVESPVENDRGTRFTLSFTR